MEAWKPVLGFDGWYSVSNLGNVRRDRAEEGTWAGRRLRPRKHNTGYASIGLTVEGKTHQRLIHRLVYEAFHGAIPKEKQINHLNSVKTDNRLDNLEIVTPQENMRLMRALRGAYNRGERHTSAILTENGVRQIRLARASGKTLASIASQFGVSFQHISDIVHRKRWQHVA